jgi:hypothetical protein
MAQTKHKAPIVPRDIEPTAMSQTGRYWLFSWKHRKLMRQIGNSSPPVLKRRNSDYIKAGEGCYMDDSGYHPSASSAPAAFHLYQPSNGEVPPGRAASRFQSFHISYGNLFRSLTSIPGTPLPSQPQASVKGEFANAFVEDWLSRTVNPSSKSFKSWS